MADGFCIGEFSINASFCKKKGSTHESRNRPQMGKRVERPRSRCWLLPTFGLSFLVQMPSPCKPARRSTFTTLLAWGASSSVRRAQVMDQCTADVYPPPAQGSRGKSSRWKPTSFYRQLFPRSPSATEARLHGEGPARIRDAQRLRYPQAKSKQTHSEPLGVVFRLARIFQVSFRLET